MPLLFCFRIVTPAKMAFVQYMILLMAVGNFWMAEGQKEKSINRLNYGVMFQHAGEVSAVTDIWKHTYAVSLPSNEKLFMDPSAPLTYFDNVTRSNLVRHCPPDDAASIAGHKMICNMWAGNAKFPDEIYTNGHDRLTELVQAIHSLIPKHENGSKGRVTKSLLPFVGSIFRGLFGTATVDEVRVLESHVVQIAKLQDSQAKVLQKSEEHMSSFV